MQTKRGVRVSVDVSNAGFVRSVRPVKGVVVENQIPAPRTVIRGFLDRVRRVVNPIGGGR
jgi:hypothetical protein